MIAFAQNLLIAISCSLVAGIVLLYVAQRNNSIRVKVILRIIAILFFVWPFLMGIYNNYIVPKVEEYASVPEPEEYNPATETASALQLASTSDKIADLIIPSSVVADDEKLKEFLVENKTEIEKYGVTGVLSYRLIREDLNKDGIDEIIVGFGFGGPSAGWVGLIAKDGEEYKLVNWESVGTYVSDMEMKDIPNNKYRSLVVKTKGGVGTGMHQQKIFVYTYINGRLKLAWDGFIEDAGFGAGGGIEYTSVVNFEDINNDGNIEITQIGTEKYFEYNEKDNDWISVKETSFVKKIFEWDEAQFKFILTE